MKRRTAADKAKTVAHRRRSKSAQGAGESRVFTKFGWSELMPTMIAALECPDTPRSARGLIRRELLKLAAAVDAQAGLPPRAIIRGVPRE